MPMSTRPRVPQTDADEPGARRDRSAHPGA
jgi:hypothetical protein